MALYTENDIIYDIIRSDEGQKIICDKISEYGREMNIELRSEGTKDEVLLIQVLLTHLQRLSGNLNYYSNIVSAYVNREGRKEVMVNPISDSHGENKTAELMRFIKNDLIAIHRDIKIGKLLLDGNL